MLMVHMHSKSRNLILVLYAFLALAASAVSSFAHSVAFTDPPNVIYILCDDFAKFQDSFDFLRANIPSKPAIFSEFSLVWKHKNNLEKGLNTWPEGADFASLHGRDPKILVRDYFNFAIRNGVSEAVWNEFLVATPWYDTGFLGKAYEVMQDNGTAIATFAFQKNSSGGSVLQLGDAPWILNPIFANRTATNNLHPAPVNLQFFEGYTGW